MSTFKHGAYSYVHGDIGGTIEIPNGVDVKITFEKIEGGYRMDVTSAGETQSITLHDADASEAEAAQRGAEAAQAAAEAAQTAAETAQGKAEDAQAAAEGVITDVQAEGQEQIDAIDAEAARVLETIPADYSELSEDVSGLKTQINGAARKVGTDAEGIDLDITDPNGNSLVRFFDGGIQTKEFDSAEINTKIGSIESYEAGKNLVDPAKRVDGAIQSSGSIATNDSWAIYGTSDYVALDANTDYAFAIFSTSNSGESPAGDQRLLLLLFDESKNPVSNSYQNVNNAGTLTFNSGSTAKYVRVSGRKSYNFQLVKGTTSGQYIPYDGKDVICMPLGSTPMGQAQGGNVLYGKKWAVCGDSFTAGATSTKITTGRYAGRNYVYPYLIGNRNNMEILKFFNGGQTLAFPATPGAFTNSLTYTSGTRYYQNIPSDVDYITIYLGINDANHASGSSIDGEDTTGEIPLGEITDNTTATYYGAWNVVLTWLITNRPNAHIGIIVTNGNASNDNYRLAQIAIAGKYGIPYIDLNGDARTPAMIRTSNPNIASAVKTALIEKWRVSSSDTHPNDAAHLFESTFIENFLRTI